ncbi:hypothetical protein ALQ15_04994 [Pseudomonas syringae pv. actinidiae]|uniref:DUF1534 domain-containing protein n=1 Tax=Pseudomonas syringae pv. actinidiae TaxID=103796 RepID=A0A7Z6U779_PSESF|nr:hypothetical protein ALQ15_04994 [Pseudomonas syringae pv. actinidiae]
MRSSFRTLQRGNAVLDALRPILNGVAKRTRSVLKGMPTRSVAR